MQKVRTVDCQSGTACRTKSTPKLTSSLYRLEKGLSVEIYQVNGPLCPVAAWKKYRSMTRSDDGDLPAFRTEEGWGYSHANMNKDLRSVFQGRVEYGAVSGHSFRIGLASLLAECGYSDEGKHEQIATCMYLTITHLVVTEIQAIGRWSSACFQTYIRRPRVTRLRTARKLASTVELGGMY